MFGGGLELVQRISEIEPLFLPDLIETEKNGIPLKTIKR